MARGKDRQVMGKVTKVWVTGVKMQEDKKIRKRGGNWLDKCPRLSSLNNYILRLTLIVTSLLL